MQLKRLEMYGFKSFADKIDIEFDQSLTGIVGPNGSGKSNIADAVRWVLGEQNARTIRAAKIEDIIFKGTSARRALGTAQVTLTFENDGNSSIDFKEIAVTRRIFRTGESEFFINNSRCRLKDIAELFADTGIGLNGISIINQSRVDDILRSKPEERRSFFEEAIGVMKYRNHRRETLNKLEDTKINLLRVADIINEIETQLQPLKIQAQRTLKYNNLYSQYKNLKFTQLQQKQKILLEELKALSRERRLTGDRIIELQTSQSEQQVENERLNQELIETEHQLYIQSEQNEKLRSTLDANLNEMSKLKERQQQNKYNHSQLEKREIELSERIEATGREIDELNNDLQKQRNELKSKQDRRFKIQGEFDETEQARQSQVKKRRELEDAVKPLQNKLIEEQKKLLITEHDLTAHEREEQSNSLAVKELQTALEGISNERAELQIRQESIKAKTDEITAAQNILIQSRSEISKTLEQFRQEYYNLNQKIQILTARLQFLKKIQNNYEGFAKAPKMILMSKENWRAGICGAVGELLKVPKEFAYAIEIALGGNLQNIVTEDEQTAKSAIAFLKRGKLGRATFLPLSNIEPAPKLNEIAEKGVIGFADTLVETQTKFAKVASFLLSRTLVVDDIDNALAISKRHRVKIVTLGGEVLNIGGSISGGSTRQAESGIFSRAGEIEQLTSELTTLSIKAEDFNHKWAAADKEISSINQKLENQSAKLNQLNIEDAEIRTTDKQLSKAFDEKQANLTHLKNTLKQQSQSINDLQRQCDFYADEIEQTNSQIQVINRQLEEQRPISEKLEAQAKALTQDLREMEIENAGTVQQIKWNEKQIDQLHHNQQKAETELKTCGDDKNNLTKNLSADAVAINNLTKELETLKTTFSYGQDKYKQLYALKMERLASLAESEKALKELTRLISTAQNKFRGLELDGAKLNMSINDNETKLQEFNGAEELDFNEDEIIRQLQEISSEIEQLGAVNPNAPQEFAELNKRREFLKRQLDDLNTAKSNLNSIIKETDEKISEQFLAAFDKIKVYFAEMFTKLFDGGSAQLTLTDKDDALNSGIEISAALPKKKKQPLSALSGGERALTVLALLFAFIKFRSPPFCILDEVDAPLDEANLLKFGGFLRKFAAQTQFIIITHRKLTMEAVSKIYGITLEQGGVSKILSLKLDSLADSQLN